MYNNCHYLEPHWHDPMWQQYTVQFTVQHVAGLHHTIIATPKEPRPEKKKL